MANHLEELHIHGGGSSHFLVHDRRAVIHEMTQNFKRPSTAVSGGILNSMFESCEDVIDYANHFKTPTLVCLAGLDRFVKNGASLKFL